MREILGAAGNDEIAYRGEGPPEQVDEGDNWQRFLDLLEEVGGADHADEIFRLWVIRPSQVETLDARAEARTAYAGLEEAAGGWSIPYYVRSQMEAWLFSRAHDRIAEANDVLDQRAAIDELATELDLRVPPGLEEAWETADRTLEDARTIAD